MLVACANTNAASAPIIATANSPATRATALLTADAVPVSRSATDVITAVETGPATKLMPMPNTTIIGSTANQRLCSGAVSPSPRNATPTISEPTSAPVPAPAGR